MIRRYVNGYERKLARQRSLSSLTNCESALRKTGNSIRRDAHFNRIYIQSREKARANFFQMQTNCFIRLVEICDIRDKCGGDPIDLKFCQTHVYFFEKDSGLYCKYLYKYRRAFETLRVISLLSFDTFFYCFSMFVKRFRCNGALCAV